MTSFCLNDVEWNLLSQLGRECGGSKSGTAPWECLQAVASALGYTVSSGGDLKGQGNSESNKKRRRADNESKETQGKNGLASAGAGPPRLLVPVASLQADGEAAYLAAFRADTLVDDRSANSVTPLKEAVATNRPEAVLRSLLAPCSAGHFAETVREQAALLVQRPQCPHYHDGLLPSADIWKLLKAQQLQYGVNVDVAVFTAERLRQTFNFNGAAEPPEGAEPEVADVAVVRKRYAAGASVRLLHPQRWVGSVARLLAPLEELLQCPLGCNAYLTPPSSQGFAPHFDDVDVYVLQAEGRKRWRVYAPLPGHALPRYSSRDFVESEVGACMLDVVLAPGDLLYLPRGTIHQAEALPGAASLHLTVSADYRRSWADLLEASLQEGMDDLRKHCFAARLAVPPALYHFCGLIHRNRLAPSRIDSPSAAQSNGAAAAAAPLDHRRFPASDCQLNGAELWPLRQELASTLDALMGRLAPCLHGGPADRAADALATAFVAERLPPSWLPERHPDTEEPDEGDLREAAAMRVAAPTLARLVDEADPDCLAVRHCLNNSRAAHAAGAAAAATPGGSGNDDGDDSEADVLRLPFFLVPRPCAGAVAAQLLNATAAQRQAAGGGATPDAAGGSRDGVQRGKKKGKRKRRGSAVRAPGAAAADGISAEDAAEAERAAEAVGLLRGGGARGGADAVLEVGCPWQEQIDAPGGADADAVGAMDREEVEETVAEVKWTMAQLGLCLPPPDA
eukprot:jgi/Ulvmu1/9241/UM005_0341.1